MPTSTAARRSAFDTRALHAALETERRARGTSWAQVSRESGVSAATLSRTAHGGPMELDGIRAMIRWLGRESAGDAAEREARALRLLQAHHAELEPRRVDALAYLVRIAFRPGRFDTRALHAALEARRKERRLTWAQTAAEIGVAPSMVTHTAQGGRIGVDTMLAMVAWLGFPKGADGFTYTPGDARAGTRTSI